MPKYGALGATFQIARIVQACCLVAIIGLTANFIAEIVDNDATPPGIFIGTITIVRPNLTNPSHSLSHTTQHNTIQERLDN